MEVKQVLLSVLKQIEQKVTDKHIQSTVLTQNAKQHIINVRKVMWKLINIFKNK